MAQLKLLKLSFFLWLLGANFESSDEDKCVLQNLVLRDKGNHLENSKKAKINNVYVS